MDRWGRVLKEKKLIWRFPQKADFPTVDNKIHKIHPDSGQRGKDCLPGACGPGRLQLPPEAQGICWTVALETSGWLAGPWRAGPLGVAL